MMQQIRPIKIALMDVLQLIHGDVAHLMMMTTGMVVLLEDLIVIASPDVQLKSVEETSLSVKIIHSAHRITVIPEQVCVFISHGLFRL